MASNTGKTASTRALRPSTTNSDNNASSTRNPPPRSGPSTDRVPTRRFDHALYLRRHFRDLATNDRYDSQITTAANNLPSTNHRRHLRIKDQNILDALVPVAGAAGGVAGNSFMWRTAHMHHCASNPGVGLGRVRRGRTEDAFWKEYRKTIQGMNLESESKVLAEFYGDTQKNDL